MKQKYNRGDRVLLKKEFPSYMDHFSGKGLEAIVQYSYGDRYGRPGHGGGYNLLILDAKPFSSSWYEDGCIEKRITKSNKANLALLEKYWNK